MTKRLAAVLVLLLGSLCAHAQISGSSSRPLIVQNNGSTVGTATGQRVLNFASGCTPTYSGGVFNITCSGGVNVTVNGGSNLTSPVNFQNGTGGNTINFVAVGGNNIQANIPTDTITNAMIQNPGTTVAGQICSLGGSCSIAFSNLTGTATAGQISPSTCTVSNVTAQSSNQTAVTLCTSSLAAGQYFLRYYADMSTVCTTGSNSVSFTFNWTDGTNARSLTTGSLTLGTAQLGGSYLSGSIPVYVSGSAAITYTSTVSGTCATGTSAYDVHAEVTL